MQDKRDGSRLVIHTTQEGSAGREPLEEQVSKVKWEPLPHPMNTGRRARRARLRSKHKEDKAKLTPGEKLMRNTAIACALLISVLALKNLDQPWSNQATEGLRKAMTMRIDLDETLGRLQFVRALVPEAALVFWNMDAGNALITPVSGTVSHAYDEAQPWMEFRCQGAQAVYAAASGQVSAVGQGAEGDYILSILHEDGTETVYAYMESVSVKKGDQVEAGAQLGMTDDVNDARLYFELRKDGQPADPSGRMAGGRN